MLAAVRLHSLWTGPSGRRDRDASLTIVAGVKFAVGLGAVGVLQMLRPSVSTSMNQTSSAHGALPRLGPMGRRQIAGSRAGCVAGISACNSTQERELAPSTSRRCVLIAAVLACECQGTIANCQSLCFFGGISAVAGLHNIWHRGGRLEQIYLLS